MGGKSSKIYTISDSTPVTSVADELVLVHEFVPEAVDEFVNARIEHIAQQRKQMVEQANGTTVNDTISSCYTNKPSHIPSQYFDILPHGSASNERNGKNKKTLKNKKSINSLSSFAFRQHLKQEHSYIPTEIISCSLLSKKPSSGQNISHNSMLGFNSYTSVHTSSGEDLLNHPSHSDAKWNGQKDEKAQGKLMSLGSNGSSGSSGNSLGLGLGLSGGSANSKHKISQKQLQDEFDWVPVSDDEIDDETLDGSRSSSVRNMMQLLRQPSSAPVAAGANRPVMAAALPPLLLSENDKESPELSPDEGKAESTPTSLDTHGTGPASGMGVPPTKPKQSLLAKQSYMFTQSGTVLLDGFVGAIGKTGIKPASTDKKSCPGIAPGTSTHGNATSGPSGSILLPMKERLLVLCKLGSGASSVVYKALDLSEMRLVALKVVPVFERGKRRQMKKELTTLFQMLRLIAAANSRSSSVKGISDSGRNESEVTPSAPLQDRQVGMMKSKELYDFIVNFYDAFSVLDEGGVAMMMEYMDGGSLQDIVDSGGCDDEDTLATIALQGLMGLKFLHDCNQIHRDLKPGNLLINKRGDVKVADLGILKQLDPVVESDSGAAEGDTVSSTVSSSNTVENGNFKSPSLARTNTFVGTATYMSPERINGSEYSFPSDVWAFGLSIMAVAIGKLPIQSKGGYWAILQSIRDAPSPSLPPNTITAEEALNGSESGVYWSDDFRSFLGGCLKKEPAERLTCAELLEHPFVLKAQAQMDESNAEAVSNSSEEGYYAVASLDGSVLVDENGNRVIPDYDCSTTRLTARFSPASFGVSNPKPSSLNADTNRSTAYYNHIKKELLEVDSIVDALFEHLKKQWREILIDHWERQEECVEVEKRSDRNTEPVVETVTSSAMPAMVPGLKLDLGLPLDADAVTPPIEVDTDSARCETVSDMNATTTAPAMPRLFPALKLQLEPEPSNPTPEEQILVQTDVVETAVNRNPSTTNVNAVNSTTPANTNSATVNTFHKKKSSGGMLLKNVNMLDKIAVLARCLEYKQALRRGDAQSKLPPNTYHWNDSINEVLDDSYVCNELTFALKCLLLGKGDGSTVNPNTNVTINDATIINDYVYVSGVSFLHWGVYNKLPQNHRLAVIAAQLHIPVSLVLQRVTEKINQLIGNYDAELKIPSPPSVSNDISNDTMDGSNKEPRDILNESLLKTPKAYHSGVIGNRDHVVGIGHNAPK